MSFEPIRVLLLEDLPSDAELAEREIERLFPGSVFRRVETRDTYLSALSSFHPDVILSDYKLPSFDGLTALRAAVESSPEVPFIIITGSMNEDTAVECMKAGAWDYVIKEHIKRLGTAVRGALEEARLRSDRKKTADALAKSEKRFRWIFERSPVGKSMTGIDGSMVVNKAFLDMLGYTQPELRAKTWRDITYPEDVAESEQVVRSLLDGSAQYAHFEKRYLHRTGEIVWAEVFTAMQQDEAGRPLFMVTSAMNITERKRAEAVMAAQLDELRRWQKIMLSREERVLSLKGEINDLCQRLNEPFRYLGESETPSFTPDPFLLSAVSAPEPGGADAPDGRPEEPLESHGSAERSRLALLSRLEDLKISSDTLKRSLDTQKAVSEVIRLSLEDLPLDALLQKALETILEIPWLLTEKKGSILLLDDTSRKLTIRAAYGLSEETRRQCARVSAGDCLCARALLSGRPIFTNQVDERCENCCGDMDAFCRYRVPISTSGKVHGVLNVYVPADHTYSQSEAEVLSAVGDSVAGILKRLKIEEENKHLEEQVHQSQKMEAIGRLAGGVAHDFNNLLSVILSCADFAMDEDRPLDLRRKDLAQVKQVSERAAALTHQLLAFSRKQVLKLEALSLNRVALSVEKMLRRILGEDIDYVQTLEADLGMVSADFGQIEQVLMNLAVNARDAMPNGGRLTVETLNVEPESDAALPTDLKPGPYVQLAVTDTGCGMDEQTKARIFEPFFTTKEAGKGTGLGLSTVYGIVAQCGGTIRVDSEPGRGTAFKIYLPRLDEAVSASKAPVGRPEIRTGTETVLVVEDDEAVRQVAGRILTSAGYTVLTAANGGEAIQFFRESDEEIHLALTDVVMPFMDGEKFAEWLKAFRPEVKIIYMSGYTDDTLAHRKVTWEGTHFIVKPFNASDLTCKIREVLDETGVDEG